MIGILSLYHYRILGLPLLNPSPLPTNLKGSSQVVRWPERLADGRLLSDVAEEDNAQAWAIQKRGNHGDFMGFSDGIHGNSKITYKKCGAAILRGHRQKSQEKCEGFLKWGIPNSWMV